MHALKVSLRDSGNDCESNCWMAEDAIGYGNYDPMASADGRKNILIVDDINDSGATLNWIHNDWGPEVEWGRNVRVAVLYDNESSDSIHTPDYSAENINKAADPQWIVFPWEEWWRRWNPEEQHN